MVEYIRNEEGTTDTWTRFLTETASDIHFYIYKFRINGVEYTTRTSEFEEAFNKAKVWQKLNARK